ncbi:flagellar hook-basal body complex protein FliE [Pullulanibacillus sp. KACC 23026]|uniref:flagellar hook-basal body complex protein FliE n=1 Tax=Pullulanibacillus sp. KACC 23026 TaxID=3028315 RepID=UPI0023B1BA9B|nr:flagellar hook-basal body complex protein FliE [Pullulanibacillus sp. KACC 23026]WEG11237.1 flagellar hook-basal body complex protein FliE [Pullulanibacillus sp. KACC 23026]
MNISSVANSAIKINQNPFQNTTVDKSQNSFSNVLKGYLNNVEQSVNQASDLSAQVATGDIDNIEDVSIASEKAKLGLELTTTVRDKAVEAYQNIMQMQI